MYFIDRCLDTIYWSNLHSSNISLFAVENKDLCYIKISDHCISCVAC